MKNKKHLIKSSIIGLISGFINGLFGSGGGTIIVPSLTHFLGLPQYKAHATALIIIFPLSIISSIIYLKNKLIDFQITLKVSMGAMIGAYIGAKLLNKVPNKVLKKIFGVFIIIAAIRMVF